MSILRHLALAIAILAMQGAPATAAQSPDPADRVDSYARAFVATGVAPSVSIAITRDGNIIYEKSFGYRSIEPKLPAEPGTAYDIASLSKQFTAASLALLASQGKIDVHAPLSRYLPEIPHAKAVTVAQVYGMTSGYQDTNDESKDAAIPLATRIANAAARPLLFEPGTRFSYSNTNYELLGLLVERVSGMPFATFVQTKIAQPLHLKSWRLLGAGKLPQDRATGYFFPTPIRGYPDPDAGKRDLLGASGDMWIDAGDMAAWDEALLGHRVVSAAMWRMMTTGGTLRDGAQTGYGAGLFLGEFRGHRLVWHGGNHVGSTTENWILPDDRISITAFCNGGLAAAPQLVRAIAALYVAPNGTAPPTPSGTPKPVSTPQLPPGLQAEALGWLERALSGRETAAPYGQDFAAMGRRYGAPQQLTPLAFQNRGTTLMSIFSVELRHGAYIYYYDGTKKAGQALLPIWSPPQP